MQRDRRPIGMLETFELYEKGAGKVLTHDEQIFIEQASDRKGCRCKKNSLTLAERQRVCVLGEKMRVWYEASTGRRLR